MSSKTSKRYVKQSILRLAVLAALLAAAGCEKVETTPTDPAETVDPSGTLNLPLEPDNEDQNADAPPSSEPTSVDGEGESDTTKKLNLVPKYNLESQRLVSQAVQEYNQKNNAKALELLQQAVDADPKNDMAYRTMGVIYGESGQTDKAIVAFESALRIDSTSPESLVNLAVAQTAKGKYKQAANACRRAIEHAPRFADAYRQLAQILRVERQFDEAADALGKLAELKPDDERVALDYGSTLQLAGRHDEAVTVLKQIVDKHPGDADAHLRLGVAYRSTRENETALAEFQEAARLAPQSPTPQWRMGEVLTDLNRFDEALEACKTCLRVDRDNVQCYLTLAYVHYAQKQCEDSKQACINAVRRMTNSPHAHYSLGLAYTCLGEYANAYEEAEVLETLSPELRNQLISAISEAQREESDKQNNHADQSPENAPEEN